LVHRDLKPGNVILADDHPRIIDFGIARALDETTGLTNPGTLIGTLTFMSPEQVGGTPVGPASDIFSLGAVLAYAATGRGPFDAPYPAVLTKILNDPPCLAGISGPLLDVIAGCLRKTPADRLPLSGILARLADLRPRCRTLRGQAGSNIS
jgi:serine/threonine protein kinase